MVKCRLQWRLVLLSATFVLFGCWCNEVSDLKTDQQTRPSSPQQDIYSGEDERVHTNRTDVTVEGLTEDNDQFAQLTSMVQGAFFAGLILSFLVLPILSIWLAAKEARELSEVSKKMASSLAVGSRLDEFSRDHTTTLRVTSASTDKVAKSKVAIQMKLANTIDHSETKRSTPSQTSSTTSSTT